MADEAVGLYVVGEVCAGAGASAAAYVGHAVGAGVGARDDTKAEGDVAHVGGCVTRNPALFWFRVYNGGGVVDDAAFGGESTFGGETAADMDDAIVGVLVVVDVVDVDGDGVPDAAG